MTNKVSKVISKGCVFLHMLSLKLLIYGSFALFLFLTVLNTLISAYFDGTYREWTFFRMDNPFLLMVLFALTLSILIFFKIKHIGDKISEKVLVGGLLIFTFLMCIGWVKITHSTPVADRAFVSMAASEFLKGDYFALRPGNYLYQYPYQLGITAFVELIYKIAGNGNFKAVQYLNAVAVCVSFYALYRITKILFNNRVAKLMLVLLSGCLCAIFFTTYVYGNLFGMAFASVAVLLELLFLRKYKMRYAFWSSVSISIGIILKSNYLIVMIAMLLMLLLHFLKTKKKLSIIFIFFILAVHYLMPAAMFQYYSQKSNMVMGKGIPMISFAAMGLQDGWFGKGTYNKYTVETFQLSLFNQNKAASISRDYIKDRLVYFSQNPSETLVFFGDKIALQWAEPTYMSIWESNCSNNHNAPISDFTQSIYVGKLHNVVVGFMNYYQSLIWGCAAVFVFIRRKNICDDQMLLGLIIIGGFLFHLVWEAKSQYILQYFLFAIPYAAAGLNEILNGIMYKYRKYFT